nr:MAG TPA: regulatory protein [Caudoviricetes sp.]
MSNTSLTTTTTNTIVSSLSDFVEIKDEKVFTTSRIIAEKFGKEHCNVIRDIENLIKTMTQVIEKQAELKIEASEVIENPIDYFIEDEYMTEGQDRTYKQYLITEKGAMLLTMGFTGTRALMVKTQFIKEFTRMKNILNNPAGVIAESGSIDAMVAFGLANQRYINTLISAKQEQLLLTQQKEQAEQERDAAEELVGDVMQDPTTYSATEIAKDLGLKSAQKLNKWLQDIGFHYKQGKKWLPYAKYSDQGLVDLKLEDTGYGFKVKTEKFTNKGKMWILEKWKGLQC